MGNSYKKEASQTKLTQTNKADLTFTLAKVMIATVVLLSTYELLKSLLYPDISGLQSRVMSILFASLIATAGTYIAIKQFHKLYNETAEDLERCADTEDALRNSEERYREQVHFLQALIDNIPAPVFYKDIHTVYQGCNQQFADYLGLMKHEIIGATAEDLSTTRLSEENTKMEAQLFESAGEQIYESFIQRRDGNRYDVVFHKAAFLKADGNVGGLVGIILDITERKQAEATLQRRAAQLELLNNVSGKIAAVLELDSLFKRVTSLVQEVFGYHHVGIFTLDRQRGDLVMQARAGDFAALFPQEHRIKLRAGMVGWVGEYGRTLLTNNVDKEPHYVNFFPELITSQSELSVPIRMGEELLGVLDAQSPQSNAFDDIDVRVMETLADQVATAIANARLYQKAQRELAERKQAREALQRRAKQLELINDVSGKIAAVLEVESLFNRVASLVQEIFGYHHVGIFTLDDQKQDLIMQARDGEFANLFPHEHHVTLGSGMVGWVGKHGKTLLANDVEKEPHYVNFYPNIIPAQSELSVPIRMGREILGVLDVQSPHLNAFDNSDVVVIETLADQVAVAIANARLYQKAQRELAERKQAEAALRESETRYHTVSDLISDIAYAFSITPEGNMEYEWMTGAFDRFSNFIQESADSFKNWQQWLHPDDVPLLNQSIKTLLSGRPVVNELRLYMPDVDICWLNMRNHPVWSEEEHRVVRIIGAAQDITEQKQMEQLMLRTERLAAMGHITATLAHEIKNPLQAIHSNLELIQDFPLDPDEREESLNICYREVERLIEITKRVLSFTRAGKEAYQPVSISQHVQQTLDLLNHQMQKLEVVAKTTFAENLPPIMGEAEQIDQVLLNLILNAIEAMPDGGDLKVDIQVEREMVCLTLANDGPPIPKNHLKHIFEPFFTTKPSGAGLGLFVSHHIIQQHGGLLSAENLTDNQGVAFTIMLPIAKPFAEENPTP